MDRSMKYLTIRLHLKWRVIWSEHFRLVATVEESEVGGEVGELFEEDRAGEKSILRFSSVPPLNINYKRTISIGPFRKNWWGTIWCRDCAYHWD